MKFALARNAGGALKKLKGLAVSQSHCTPAEDADLVVRSADFHRFAFGVHSEGVVDVVDAIL